jgi:hypothetical protein
MNPVAQARRWMRPLHALLLAALLLAAQGLGLAHHVAHAQGGLATAHAGPWLDGHDDGSADCRLVDQLGHADLAFGALAALPPATVSTAPPAVCSRSAQPLAPARPYQARAPPQDDAARA